MLQQARLTADHVGVTKPNSNLSAYSPFAAYRDMSKGGGGGGHAGEIVVQLPGDVFDDVQWPAFVAEAVCILDPQTVLSCKQKRSLPTLTYAYLLTHSVLRLLCLLTCVVLPLVFPTLTCSNFRILLCLVTWGTFALKFPTLPVPTCAGHINCNL